MKSRMTIIAVSVVLVFAGLMWMQPDAADKFMEFVKWAMTAGIAAYTIRPTGK